MYMSNKIKSQRKKILEWAYSVLFTSYFLLLTSYFPSCTPLVKKPVSEEVTQGPSVRVLLATIDSEESLTFSGRYILHSEEARYELGEKNKNLNILPLQDGLQLYNENRNLLYRQSFPIILEPADPNSRFIYHGHTFAGSIYFQPAGENAVYLINKILLEDYLSGVVPAEIPAINKDDFEAIKSQAICARTYALNQIEKKSDPFFDVKATIDDQVYSGNERHTSLADQAIEETRGIIITYNNSPATVYYHSTCGGHLESAINVWPSDPIPYLEGGNDAVGDIYSCSVSPYFRWLETRTFSDLDSLFELRYKKGQLHKNVDDTVTLNLVFKVLKRNASGRVSDLQLTYGDTTVTISGYEIRHFFKDKKGKSLPSALFYFTQEDDSTVTIHGGGFGHGVGMCQFGALYMARHGFMHYHIINKYFPGTKLVRKY
jgi:stage II sporulation protein D